MGEQELLERAADAAGYAGFSYEDGHYWIDGPFGQEGTYPVQWNPLQDDGDALRLAVKLGLSIEQHLHGVSAGSKETDCTELFQDRSLPTEVIAESTRRAIVRAAAAMAETSAGSIVVGPGEHYTSGWMPFADPRRK